MFSERDKEACVQAVDVLSLFPNLVFYACKDCMGKYALKKKTWSV